MGDVITLDILDRPAGGTLRLRRALRERRRTDGLRALIHLNSGHFVTSVVPSPTLRRLAVLAAWEAGAEPDTERLLGGVRAREHWSVRGELTRAAFSEPWRGWMPDTTGTPPLGDDEPALILISGDLAAQGAPGFVRDAPRTVAHAFTHPGYLGGLALASSPRNTTSCSAWRTYADARDYAYGSGRHREAMLRDRREKRHAREWFLRIRPLRSSGTLLGADPFAGRLPAPVAV